jgi:hypothetical protein
MTLLQKYKLKASVRKSLDKLSDEDKVLFIQKYDIKTIGGIVAYYGLENNPLLRTAALNGFIQHSMEAYLYASHVIKGRWEEGEHIIKVDPDYSYLYAQNVIKGRWPEGEDAIKTVPQLAFWYARDVIKSRWEEGEDTIKTNKNLWLNYKEYFLK